MSFRVSCEGARVYLPGRNPTLAPTLASAHTGKTFFSREKEISPRYIARRKEIERRKEERREARAACHVARVHAKRVIIFTHGIRASY